MGVDGCGSPISSRAVRSSSPFRELAYSAPISASAANVITLQSSLHTLHTVPLSRVMVSPGFVVSCSFVLRKKCPPAQLLACGALKYEASLWICKTMPLAW
eukprot:12414116-Ditylum_brightwellii.AAC.1